MNTFFFSISVSHTVCGTYFYQNNVFVEYVQLKFNWPSCIWPPYEGPLLGDRDRQGLTDASGVPAGSTATVHRTGPSAGCLQTNLGREVTGLQWLPKRSGSEARRAG